MIVFISKYALVFGIVQAEGVLRDIKKGRKWEIGRDLQLNREFHTNYNYNGISETYSPNEWHKTPEEAVARANEMVKERIAKLNKELKTLKKIKFTYGGCKDEPISARVKGSARSKVGC